jgi:hypothetical protein
MKIYVDKTHSIVMKGITKEQIWKRFTDVNTWDKGSDFAKMEGKFEQGNHFILNLSQTKNIGVIYLVWVSLKLKTTILI